MAKELLALQGLSKYYTSGQTVAVGLDQITLSFCRGEFVAITGESGSGKSTLAHVLGGILPYENGELLLDGKPTSHYGSEDWERYRRDRVSFISQSYGILPGGTVLANVVSALRLAGLSKKDAPARAEAILRQVELWDLRRRRAAKLSSGQKQRLSIARALAKPAPILIADEPTGNLDPENSHKVIRLLAEAARDRLVILITHEFSECAHSATRHITLHDGRVVRDAPLRRPNQPAPRSAGVAPSPKSLSPYIAALQLRSRPVWSVLMLLLFTLTVFGMFAFAGTFIANWDDTPTRYYDGSAFLNGDSRRLAVIREDGQPMTAEDEAALLSLRHVESLDRYGYLNDISYAYREGVDYDYKYSLENVGSRVDLVYQQQTDVRLYPQQMPFAASTARLSTGEQPLTAGRMPEDIYEVVAVGGQELLGATMPVFFQDRNHWSKSAWFRLNCTVVGVTDAGSGLYFHEDLGEMFLADLRYGCFYYYGDAYLLGYWSDRAPNVSTADLLDSAALPSGKSVLSAGRMPENIYEVVAVGDRTLLGTVLPVSVRNLESGQSRTAELTVVGVIPERASQSGVLYIYDRPEEFFMTPEEIARYEQSLPDSTFRAPLEFTVPLPDGQFLMEKSLYTFLSQENYADQKVFSTPCLSLSDLTARPLPCVGCHDSQYNNVFMVNRDTYEQMGRVGGSDQVSLFLEDYAYADRAVRQLNKLGYVAISPYREGATMQDVQRAQQRVQTLRVCVIALLAVLFLQVVVLRAMFSLETDSYRLLSNIGLTCVTAQRSVYLQVLVFILCGQALGLAAIWAAGALGVPQIRGLTRWLPASHVALLSVIHLAACMLTALWTTHGLKKQVFPNAGRTTDLNWDDLREEVEA